jgi:hypothetical protein
VPATPETAVRRALWLDSAYELDRAHLLCVGDHDLTSLAVCLVRPGARVTVVDLDDAVLTVVDEAARRHGWDVTCLWADLRIGLPEVARGVADLAFTDPPYTPDGVALFLRRAVEGLAGSPRDRVLLAYGYGDHQPGLGLKVQQAVLGLHLVMEAVLPGFNRYDGAQSVGARSDLYVCRPTARTRRAVPAGEAGDPRIYTRGEQAVEGPAAAMGEAVASAVLAALDLSAPAPVLVGRRWAAAPGVPAGARQLPLAALLGRPLPAGDEGVAADLADDPGPQLLRVLLAAAGAPGAAVLVPNDHPDVATGAAWERLRDLLAPVWAVRVRRSVPDGRYAVLEARAVPPPDPVAAPGGALRRHLLLHAHGRLGTVWRDGLVAVHRRAGRPLARQQARAVVAESWPRRTAGARLLDLPRHALAEALAAADRSVPVASRHTDGGA